MARILVSDDDPHVLRYVGLCLERAGHDVVVTLDPLEVTSLARASRFDAVILDVMMVPISGFEVLRKLRREPSTASLPVLFLSGRGEGSDRVRGLREGADDYLVKPFEPEELALRVERLVAWGSRRSDEETAEAALPIWGNRAGEGAAGPEAAGEGVYRLGRYEVGDVLGEGTMGMVYRGWDPRLHRHVALKTIRLDSIAVESQRRDMLRRLHNEAITVAKFNHPNIVTVYDMGDTENAAFIAMELVEGVSFARYIDRVRTVEVCRLIPLGLGVARALEIAHERQVMHRDVKPGNVLLGRDGGIKVTDFGLANIFSRVTEEPKPLCGTPGYVPPEALRGEPYSLAGDIFSLGAMLYEAAAGVHPLTGSNLRETIERTLSGRVVPLRELRPGLPGDLTELVMELMAGAPGERPLASSVVERLESTARRGGWSWSSTYLPSDL